MEKVVRDRKLRDSSRGIVLDSLKYHQQINFWRLFARKGGYDFRLIGIDAFPGNRCNRIIARKREGDVKTSAEFAVVDARDLRGYHTPTLGQDTESCMNHEAFDLKINNNYLDVNGLYQRLGEFFALDDLSVSRT